jgi:hypothetical protein
MSRHENNVLALIANYAVAVPVGDQLRLVLRINRKVGVKDPSSTRPAPPGAICIPVITQTEPSTTRVTGSGQCTVEGARSVLLIQTKPT